MLMKVLGCLLLLLDGRSALYLAFLNYNRFGLVVEWFESWEVTLMELFFPALCAIDLVLVLTNFLPFSQTSRWICSTTMRLTRLRSRRPQAFEHATTAGSAISRASAGSKRGRPSSINGRWRKHFRYSRTACCRATPFETWARKKPVPPTKPWLVRLTDGPVSRSRYSLRP